MIARQNRFHGRGSLRPVYTKGRMVRGQLLAVKFLPNHRRTTYRAAVVVSRKVHKSAVVRNRIRRRVYELIRQSDLAAKPPVDLIVTVYSDRLASVTAPELEGLLYEQLAQIPAQ